MGSRSVAIDFIFIVSYAVLCYAEPVYLGEASLDQGSGQNFIFRHSVPVPVPGPAESAQGPVGLSSNAFQSRIGSRGPLPAVPRRPAAAVVDPPSQEFLQVPIQVQSERTRLRDPTKPLQSQMSLGLREPEQRSETPLQAQQGFQKPMLVPVLHPVVQEEEVVMQSEFEVKTPEPANTVEVHCGEVSVKVQAQQDFLGNHQFIDPSDLTLGGCPFVGFDDHARVVVFESALQGCGSTLTMTEDSLVYSFLLMYSPSPVPNTPIVKTSEAVVALHCIYPRKHNVSSNALRPTWMPYVAVRTAEERLQFSLKLMTDDWMYERPSSTYFLGSFINLEASVVRANHVPLRVFVESCAASLGPGGNSVTVYTFIGNSGCMTDAKLAGSRSAFLPRIQDDKLQFQIEAFRFQQYESGSIYITCHLRATATSRPTDVMHKACSFVTGSNSWVAVSGDDHLCECCEASCVMRKGRSLETDDSVFEGEATVGPVFVEETPPAENRPSVQIQGSSQTSSKDAEFSIELVVLTSLVVGAGILCVVILGTLFYQRRQKRFALICE